MRDTDPRVRNGQTVDAVDHRSVNWIEGLWFGALDAPGAPDEQDAQEHDGRLRDSHQEGLPNGSRLSCGADLKSSQTAFYNTVLQGVHRLC